MQLICESYDILRHILKLNNEQLAEIFSKWNTRELDSYLIEITADIFKHKQADGRYTVDIIADIAGKGPDNGPASRLWMPDSH